MHLDTYSNMFVTAEGDVNDLVDVETICAKIEALGGLVIDRYDRDAVSHT